MRRTACVCAASGAPGRARVAVQVGHVCMDGATGAMVPIVGLGRIKQDGRADVQDDERVLKLAAGAIGKSPTHGASVLSALMGGWCVWEGPNARHCRTDKWRDVDMKHQSISAFTPLRPATCLKRPVEDAITRGIVHKKRHEQATGRKCASWHHPCLSGWPPPRCTN